MLWFYFCTTLERVHPPQAGYLRRKYRKDRRPTLPRESAFVFYPPYVAELVRKHATLARLIWRCSRFRWRLKHDPNPPDYSDIALTPVAEETRDAFSILTLHTPVLG